MCCALLTVFTELFPLSYTLLHCTLCLIIDVMCQEGSVCLINRCTEWSCHGLELEGIETCGRVMTGKDTPLKTSTF